MVEVNPVRLPESRQYKSRILVKVHHPGAAVFGLLRLKQDLLCLCKCLLRLPGCEALVSEQQKQGGFFRVIFRHAFSSQHIEKGKYPVKGCIKLDAAPAVQRDRPRERNVKIHHSFLRRGLLR